VARLLREAGWRAPRLHARGTACGRQRAAMDACGGETIAVSLEVLNGANLVGMRFRRGLAAACARVAGPLIARINTARPPASRSMFPNGIMAISGKSWAAVRTVRRLCRERSVFPPQARALLYPRVRCADIWLRISASRRGPGRHPSRHLFKNAALLASAQPAWADTSNTAAMRSSSAARRMTGAARSRRGRAAHGWSFDTRGTRRAVAFMPVGRSGICRNPPAAPQATLATRAATVFSLARRRHRCRDAADGCTCSCSDKTCADAYALTSFEQKHSLFDESPRTTRPCEDPTAANLPGCWNKACGKPPGTRAAALGLETRWSFTRARHFVWRALTGAARFANPWPTVAGDRRIGRLLAD